MTMTPQEIGRQAGRVFANVLPHYLVSRSQQDQEDYGIDYEMELMLPNDQASGVIFKVQEKGTAALDLNAAGNTISYSEPKIARMRYYLKELRIPAALVIVDVTNREVYWTRLQGNPEVELAFEAAEAADQKSMTVHVPVASKLPATFPQFLEEMARGQNAVLVRFLHVISSSQVLEAARSLPNFDATVAASRAHTNWLRLEQVERTLRRGDHSGAYAECERLLRSESETPDARVAAGLNMIRLAPALFPQQRTPEQHRSLARQQVRTAEEIRTVTRDVAANDRLRLFAEFLLHTAMLAARANDLADVLATSPAGLGEADRMFVELVRRLAIRQLVVAAIAEFEEAYKCLAALIAGGHLELVSQAWAMLVGNLLGFVHFVRSNGYSELAAGIVAWVDETLPEMAKIAEDMADGISMVFCALQQVPLAAMGDMQEINRRAEVARSYIRRLPQGEQQRHLDRVDWQVNELLQPPPE